MTIDSAMTAVADACSSDQLAWGCPVRSATDLRARQQQGAQLLAHGDDFTAFVTMLQASAGVFENTPR